LTLAELQAVACEAGLPRFVGKQLCEWLYKHRVTSFDLMTNISQKARERLKEIYCIGRTEPAAEAVSVDGTRKYLFPVTISGQRSAISSQQSAVSGQQSAVSGQRSAVSSQQFIECVYLPEDDRTTLCVSTQAGCKMGCKFCMTGTLGFHGNLSAADILAQVLYFPDLTNLVLMGEGEPMDNIDNVLRALNVLTAEWGLGWSGKRITVSTVGVLQKQSAISNQQSAVSNQQSALQRFLNETDCHLAVSLHNPYPDERAAIMPAERLTPIHDVIDLLRQYDWTHQRRLSFEYICWSGVNDDIRHAKQLLRLTQGLPCRVNLIRYHSDKTDEKPLFPGSEEERMIIFRDYLSAHGVTCTIRRSRGEDILAACGMLVNALSTHHS